MDHNEIRRLLKKYWAAETGLNEEAALKDFFLNNADIPDDLLAEKNLFMAYKQQAASPALNEDLLSKMQLPANAKVVPIWKRVLRYAAVLIPLIIVTYFLIEKNTSVPTSSVISDTITDEEQKLKEATAALQMLAVNMQDGLENVKQLDILKDIGKELNEQPQKSKK